MRLPILGDDSLCLTVGKILYTLHGDEMEFHPSAFVILIYKAVGMATEPVHVAERGRYATRRHRYRHLMQRFGQKRPKSQLAAGLRIPVRGSRFMA